MNGCEIVETGKLLCLHCMQKEMVHVKGAILHEIVGTSKNLYLHCMPKKRLHAKGAISLNDMMDSGKIFNPFGYGLAFASNSTDFVSFSQVLCWSP